MGPSHVWPQRGAQAAISRGRWASSLGLPGRERRAAGLRCISGGRIAMEAISATVIRLWPIHPAIESLQQGLATGACPDSVGITHTQMIAQEAATIVCVLR